MPSNATGSYHQGVPDLLLFLDTRTLVIERIAEVKAAVDAQMKVVMAAPNCHSRFGSYGLHHLIDAPVDRLDAGGRRQVLEELKASGLDVNGVIAWKEQEVELAACLAQELGLRGSSPEAATRARNKVAMRQTLDQVPGANPRYAVCHDEASFLEGVRQVGNPCMVKPAGNSGGRGMFRITDDSNLAQVWNDFRWANEPSRGSMYAFHTDRFLVEQSLCGSEHSVSGMVIDGELHFFTITDKHVDLSLPAEIAITTPSALNQAQQEHIKQLVRLAVAAIGINWCGITVDLMYCDEGPKILEVGGRLGGDTINSHLIPLSQPWLRPYQTLFQVVQGHNPLSKKDYTADVARRAGTLVILPPGPGRIASVRGLERVAVHPSTRLMLVTGGTDVEMILPKFAFKQYEVAYVIAECSLEEDIVSVLEEINALVEVEMEDGSISLGDDVRSSRKQPAAGTASADLILWASDTDNSCQEQDLRRSLERHGATVRVWTPRNHGDRLPAKTPLLVRNNFNDALGKHECVDDEPVVKTLRSFEAAGVLLSRVDGMLLARDKLRSQESFRSLGIPHIVAVELAGTSDDDFDWITDAADRFPTGVIVKDRHGQRGKCLMKIDWLGDRYRCVMTQDTASGTQSREEMLSKDELRALFANELNDQALVGQPYVASTYEQQHPGFSESIRVFCINAAREFSMCRRANSPFNNFSLSGADFSVNLSKVKATYDEVRFSRLLALRLGLFLGGLDFIRANLDYCRQFGNAVFLPTSRENDQQVSLMLEINGVPQFGGLGHLYSDEANIADTIAQIALEQVESLRAQVSMEE